MISSAASVPAQIGPEPPDCAARILGAGFLDLEHRAGAAAAHHGGRGAGVGLFGASGLAMIASPPLAWRSRAWGLGSCVRCPSERCRFRGRSGWCRAGRAWCPSATMRPSSSTRILSAVSTVLMRWATTKLVRPWRKAASAVLNLGFGFHIHGAGAVVQDEDGRVGSAARGRWPAVVFARRKVDPALPDEGVVAVRQGADEVVRPGPTWPRR